MQFKAASAAFCILAA